MDDIIDNKLKFGPAQYIPFFFLCLVDMNDGTQLILNSLATPIIKHQWKLQSSQASLLTSIFYVGTLIGSIVSGKLADQYGRRLMLIYGCIMQLLSAISFFFVNEVYSLAMGRLMYGFSYGFTIVLTTGMFAQTSTTDLRGKGILFLNFFVSVGKIFGIFLAFLCLQNFNVGNWRLMMILSTIPNIIFLYGALNILKQSPRFLLAKKRFNQAFDVIQHMLTINYPNNPQFHHLNSQEKDKIYQWQKQVFVDNQPAQFSSLVNKQYFKTTVSLCTCWFVLNFMYHGQLVTLPFLYGKQEKTFSSYFITIGGEIPCFLLSLYLIDKPHFGRKNSLMYSFCLSAVFNFLFMLNRITLIASITRFFMKQCFQMLYAFTTQSYGTLNRTLGFGTCSAFGRLSATFMPYIIIPLVSINPSIIFFLFFLCGIIGAIATYQAPRQTLNDSIDKNNQELSLLLH